MKKFAIGCGIVVLVLAVGMTVAGYYIYSRARTYLTQFTAVAELDKDVANRAPFTPPDEGQLTEAFVVRFAAVQDSMHAKLGARIEEMKKTEDEFTRRERAEHRQATASENFTVITNLMKFIVEAKGAQVDALNQQRFSLDEYYWVRGRVYAAAGLRVMELSLRNMQGSLKEGKMTRPVTPAASDPASAHDQELVAPYLPKMKDWATLAFFGM